MIEQLEPYRLLTESSCFFTIPNDMDLMQTIFRIHYDQSTKSTRTSFLKLPLHKGVGETALQLLRAKSIQVGPDLLLFLQS